MNPPVCRIVKFVSHSRCQPGARVANHSGSIGWLFRTSMEDGVRWKTSRTPASPLSSKETRTFTWNARSYRLEPSADAELAAFQQLILDQDRPITESQRPEQLPVDLSEELHIAGPDQASIEFRRHLGRIAALGRANGTVSE